MYEEIINRLSRYSPQCIADRLDPDFAEANVDAIEILKAAESMRKLTERPKAKWTPVSTIVCRCSFCGNYIMRADIEENHFCYKCGSDMRGE